MEDILASIRRILNEDEAPKSAPEPNFPVDPKPGVLVLDASMMVPETPVRDAMVARDPEPAPRAERASDPEPPPPVTALAPLALGVPKETVVPPAAPDTSTAQPKVAQPGVALVAPEAAAAAGASVDALMRTLATERNTAVQRGGPTIEDLVRAEIRPLLKDWLDNHLPPLVERLVRAEIERVVSRMAP